MSLEEIVDNSRTDKNTVHSYLPIYQDLLISKKESAQNILEIGILHGGSIKLWNDFFKNATIYGLDGMNINSVWNQIKNNDKIVLYTSSDPYNNDFFITNFLSKNIKFDFMLDDGPHTLESMIQFIKLYSQVMAEDGILIIEDVQSFDWIDILKNEVPEELKQYIKIYDLRSNKNRYDDILFIIDKSSVLQKIELMNTRLLKRNIYQINDLSGLSKKCDWFICQNQILNITNTEFPKFIFLSAYNGNIGIKYFVLNLLEKITSPFILIIASEDHTFPTGKGDKRCNVYLNSQEYIKTLMQNKYLIHIFVENLDEINSKMTPIPLGLAVMPGYCKTVFYDINLPEFLNINFSEKKILCHSCIRIRDGEQWLDRKNVIEYSKNEWNTFVTYYEQTNNEIFIESLKKSKFCLCVHGGGYDPCPKFFEAILNGSIPIIQHSPLDEAFSKFPVVFVDEWNKTSISEEFLLTKLEELRDFYEDIDKRKQVLKLLTLEYWWDIISSKYKNHSSLL